MSTSTSIAVQCSVNRRHSCRASEVRSRSGYLHQFWPADADPCSTYMYSLSVFCRVTSTPADSPLSADWHVPVASSLPSANTSGFRKQRVGRSSSLLGSPTPVCAECGCSTDVSSPPIWPHHRRVGLSSQAARVWASWVQDFRTDVQSLARTRATIPWSAQPRCRPIVGRRSLRSTDSNRMVVPSIRLSTVANRAFLVVGPQIGWSDVRLIVDHIPPATENSPFFISFPGYLLDIN